MTVEIHGTKKTVFVPIMFDHTRDLPLAMIRAFASSENDSIKRSNFNLKHYSDVLHMPLLESVHDKYMSNPSPYNIAPDDENEVRNNQNDKMLRAQALVNYDGHGHVHLDNSGTFEVDLSRDPVEGNRSTFSHVTSAFFPDGKSLPRTLGCPVNFLQVTHPYIVSLAIFFPDGKKGLNDPDRVVKVTEAEFVKYHLRNVKKDLLEFPLFTFLAALRLETSRFLSSYQALRGYSVNEQGVVEVGETPLNFMHHTGSKDYYQKQRHDLTSKCRTFGYPSIFYTFSCSNCWEVVLASCLLQEGYDVTHVEEEPDAEELSSTDSSREYMVHVRSSCVFNCPSHTNCMRVNVNDFFGSDTTRKDELLNRNLYTTVRIFQQKSRAVVENTMTAPDSGLKVKAFHDLKEFGNVSGRVHLHGVAWRKMDDETDEIFDKLHKNQAITHREKMHVSELADTLISVSTDSSYIKRTFPNLSEEKAESIARLAVKYQEHTCTSKCESDVKLDCWYNYPQEPSAVTLVSSPPDKILLGKEVFENLVAQADAVKEAVKSVLRKIRVNGDSSPTNMKSLLEAALDKFVMLEDDKGFQWRGGVFPLILSSSHSVNFWKQHFMDQIDSPDGEYLQLLAVYHTALSVSRDPHHHLVMRRGVSEAWIAEYNPQCLEDMKSNISIRLVLHTPETVLNYITKGNNIKDGKERSQDIIVNKLREMSDMGDTDAEWVADRAENQREVSLPEAFFRIDDQLHLAESNVAVVYVDTHFPNLRKATFVTSREQEGTSIPGRPGKYTRTSRAEDKYEKR